MSARRAEPLLALAALLLAPVPAGGGRAWAAEPVQVSATASPAPAGAGWIEARLVLTSGARPWRGAVAVAGQAAQVQVRVALPERSQRVVVLPLPVGPGEGAPRLWIDGVAAGRVRPAAEAAASRVVVVAEPAEVPRTWRALDALDLLILPPAAEAGLQPAQTTALQQWVRWGGALALTGGGERLDVRPVGRGVAIAAPNADEARRAWERWRRAAGPDVSRLVLAAWEGAERARAAGVGDDRRPGAGLAVVLAVYLALLGAATFVLARVPGARRAGVRLAIVLAGGASLAGWAVARAGGGPPLAIDETALVRARPDGGAAHVAAAVRVRADHRATYRIVPLLALPLLAESLPSRVLPSPGRALAWDADAAAWERAWALGESATLRVDGIATDVEVRAAPSGEGWAIDNHGGRALRDVVVVVDGRPRRVADIPAGARARVEAPRASGDRTLDPFWAPLLSRIDAGATGRVLLAVLDPPVRTLQVAGTPARTTGQSRLILPLPEREPAPWRR